MAEVRHEVGEVSLVSAELLGRCTKSLNELAKVTRVLAKEALVDDRSALKRLRCVLERLIEGFATSRIANLRVNLRVLLWRWLGVKRGAKPLKQVLKIFT